MHSYNNVWKRKAVGVIAAAVCVTAFTMPAAAEEDGLGIVETQYGQAQGVAGAAYEDLTVFKGIPYAAPPVGDLRWAAPEDPESWDDVRVFDTYGAAPMQWPGDMEADPWKTDFYYDDYPEFSEDCLYLNVITPAESGDEELPVYVWLHGGGNNHGWSYEVEGDPEALAAKGAVVVQVGTRLGVFGYMALPQLDEVSDYGASGNYALMDLIKALDWVKENIEGFGGNPDNITLGGQSGGTHKTAALFASEYGSSYANGIIWQSGLKYDASYGSLESLEEKSIAWLQTCGLTGEESLEELRSMDAEVFMGTADEYKAAPQSYVVDGEYIIYETLKEAYESGMFEGVNIMVGTNLGESGALEIANTEEFYAYFRELLGDELYEEYDFESLVSPSDEEAADVARRLVSYGFNTNSGRNVTLNELFGAYYHDLYPENNVYTYLFSHFTPGRDEDYWWAWHSSELWYTFGSMRDVPEQRDWEDWDYELSDIVMSYWVNFMATGDPNGEGLAEWLPSTSEQLAYMNLGEEDTLGSVTANQDALTELMIAFCQQKFGI